MKGLQGLKVVEVGGAVAMPIVGQLLGSWGAEVVHVEPPVKGDNQRHQLKEGMAGWAKPHDVNYLWEHVDRNKKSIAIDLKSNEGQEVLHRLIAQADVFSNNLRPYEVEKFNLSYENLKKLNKRLIYANLTGYGSCGEERDTGGYDSVAFWARSGVMELMHDAESPPNISRPAYGDHITSLSLLAGIMSALYIREHTGVAQKVEVSLFNTALWVLGFDISGCLITGEESFRPHRRTMGNPIRNVYRTGDGRWIMLGMTNAQHYWPDFCRAIDREDLQSDRRFATYADRAANAPELITILDDVFLSRALHEWVDILKTFRLVWAPVATPLEAAGDPQAVANDFFVDWNHPEYGPIRVLNNPIKLEQTPARIHCPAPALGQHTDELLKDLGYSEDQIESLKKAGKIG